MQAGFKAKFVAEKPILYEVSTTPSDGRNAYYYVLVDTDNCAEFECKMKITGSLKLSRFGTIVASGFGTPHQELKRQLMLKYNVKPA